MKVGVIRFSSKLLGRIHPDHRGFIIAAAHCSNELLAISPYLLFENDRADLNEVEKSIVTVRQLTLVRFLISKIVEFDDLVQKYIGRLKKTFPQAAAKVIADYKPISRSINAATWSRKLRNKISFHYNQQHAEESFSKIVDDTALNVIAGPHRGFTSYTFAEEIVSRPFFEDVGGGSFERGLETALDFITDVEWKIADFVTTSIIKHFEARGLMSESEKMELRDEFCASPNSLHIPLAVKHNPE
jgi:hypothetical protein